MAIFTVPLYAGNPKRFTRFHVNVIAARFPAPLALKLHQASAISAIEVQRATSL